MLTAVLSRRSMALDHFDLRELDLLILDPQVDVHPVGYGVATLLKAFPFEHLRPSLIHYRHANSRELVELLARQGYATSAHHETPYWGEHNLAWRNDRCHLAGSDLSWVPLLTTAARVASAADRDDGEQEGLPRHIEL